MLCILDRRELCVCVIATLNAGWTITHVLCIFGNQREIWASEQSLRAATMMAYSPFGGLPSAREVFADYMNEFVLGGSPKQPLIADDLVRDAFFFFFFSLPSSSSSSSFRSSEPPIVL